MTETPPVAVSTRPAAAADIDFLADAHRAGHAGVADARGGALDTLLKAIGESELGMSINNDAGSGIDRSDQWAFARAGVPAIALFAGVHDEYHSPRDRASLIVPDKLQNVARLVAMAAWELSAQDGEE